MIVVRFKGGLGNQLFQYAAGRALAARHGVPLQFDARWYDRSVHQQSVRRSFDLMHFAVHGRAGNRLGMATFFSDEGPFYSRLLAAPLLRLLPGHQVWVYDGQGFPTDFNRLGRQVRIEGYFQDPRYFAPVQQELRAELNLVVPPPDGVVAYAASIAAGPSVCIQVRRTDFVSNAEAAAVHGTCGLDYFKSAWANICQRVPAAQGLVFTDDPIWAREAFHSWPDVSIVGSEWDGPAYMHKFFLMRSCRHFIIANSTWGWWAAWLSRFPEKTVVMPKKWFTDGKLNETAAGLRIPGWLLC